MFVFNLTIDHQPLSWAEDNWTATAREAWDILATIALEDGITIPAATVAGEWWTDRAHAIVSEAPIADDYGIGHALTTGGTEHAAPWFDGPAEIAWDSATGTVPDDAWPADCECMAIADMAARERFVVDIISPRQAYRWARPVPSDPTADNPAIVAIVSD